MHGAEGEVNTTKASLLEQRNQRLCDVFIRGGKNVYRCTTHQGRRNEDEKALSDIQLARSDASLQVALPN